MQALTPPPDDLVQVALGKPLADDVAAIAGLESAARQLQADARAGNDTAANRDYSGPYRDAYDALIKADSDLAAAVQVDASS